MATLPIHEYFVFNDEIHSTEHFAPSDSDGGVYEVLRVKNGVPLFVENHLQRFRQSAAIANMEIPCSDKRIVELLHTLIETNDVSEGNIFISCKAGMKAFFIPHSYPTADMYTNGVVCRILKAERENPNAKIFQTAVRQRANALIEQTGCYEVLLADANNNITEGSRSNVFFIRNSEIVTAPGASVLLGITRQKAIELAAMLNINVVETEIPSDELQKFEAVFLTGTSPKILPVKKIDGFEFNVSGNIQRKIIDAYNSLIEQYIADSNRIK